MTPDNTDAIVSKIQKLLRLAEKAGTPEEAAAAAAKAQELQQTYRISSLALEAETGTKEDIGTGELLAERRTTAWRMWLGNAIAKANGCKMYTRKQRSGYGSIATQMLIGRPSDQEAVRELFKSLEYAIESIARRECRGRGVTYANSFRLGCVGTIQDKFAAAKLERERSMDSSSMSLIVLSDKAVELWQRQNLPLRRRVGRAPNINDIAYGHGKIAAQGISVTRAPAQLS